MTAALQPSLFESLDRQALRQAVQRREKGIRKAVTHAEQEIAEWNAKADYSLSFFARSQGFHSFLAEQWVDWARIAGLPQPPDPRAFGGVIIRAARSGLIQKIGYAPANSSNRSPKCLWRLSA